MYDWFKEFLFHRTIQVRVGNALSKVHCVESGTAQGGVISPILITCMMNDLPDGLCDIETSLFADGSAIYKSGTNYCSHSCSARSSPKIKCVKVR